VPAEGHYVQLSSQRDEAQAAASLAAMQSRYSSILGGINPDIQRADLGAKGIYYRARVGPFPTRPEAIEVCEKLKAAGSTCIVTR
jgi:cell division protein FtsN